MFRPNPRSILPALALAVAIALSTLTLAPPATAGTYTVGYGQHAAASDTQANWIHKETAGAHFWSENQPWLGYFYRRFGPNDRAIPAGATSDLTYTAPKDTFIGYVQWAGSSEPLVPGAVNSMVAWLDNGAKLPLATGTPGGAQIGNGSYSFGADIGRTVQSSLGCHASGPDCWGITSDWRYGNVWYFHGATVHLVDNFDPVIDSVGGAGWAQTPPDGQNPIAYAASDRGAGVKSVELHLDGVKQATGAAACTREHVPCPLSEQGSFTLDTTKLSEGDHTVRVVAEDFSGNTTESTRTITVRRKPAVAADTGGPRITGVTDPFTVGERATAERGSWTGADVTFADQWQRCDANGLNCAPIAGVSALTYTAASQDVGRTLVFCTTATSTGGSTTACSDPTPMVQADADRDGVPDSTDRCPSVAATTADGCAPIDAGTNTAGPGGGDRTSVPAKEIPGTIGRDGVNGANGGPGSKFTTISTSRARTLKVKFGKRVRLTGRLVGPTGAPVAGGVITVHSQHSRSGAAMNQTGRLVTDAGGRFSYLAPTGPSRLIRFAYRAYSTDTTFADTSDVRLLVAAGVTMRATPTKVRNRQATVFKGRLLGRPLPPRGVVVDLQVFFRKKWRTFAAPRTNRRGHYRFKYRFMAGAATWRFRARVRKESAYAFEVGHSKRPVRVTVR